MTGLCTQISSSGFWQGLWDGITAPVTLIASLFFNVQFYDLCARSWWYNCMFLFGVFLSLLLGIMSPSIAVITFFVCLMAFIIWLIFANILYILAFAVLCAVLWTARGFFVKPKSHGKPA
jgi:hypothetical protein